jgi:hypothetical protein
MPVAKGKFIPVSAFRQKNSRATRAAREKQQPSLLITDKRAARCATDTGLDRPQRAVEPPHGAAHELSHAARAAHALAARHKQRVPARKPPAAHKRQAPEDQGPPPPARPARARVGLRHALTIRAIRWKQTRRPERRPRPPALQRKFLEQDTFSYFAFH